MGFTAGVTQHRIIKFSELKGTHKGHLAICCQKTPSPNVVEMSPKDGKVLGLSLTVG